MKAFIVEIESQEYVVNAKTIVPWLANKLYHASSTDVFAPII